MLCRPGLLPPAITLFGAYQFGEEEYNTLKAATAEQLRLDADMSHHMSQAWANALTFHHQWMVLSREHALALVALKPEIIKMARSMHRACNSVKAGMAPDEFILLTTLRVKGLARSIQRTELKQGMVYAPGTLLNCYPTLVLFPAEVSPHPVLWTDPNTRVKCQVGIRCMI